MSNLQYQRARESRDDRFDGLFFVAVRTTGIFCRPICPANPPLESNVDYYSSAELAMDAGFRPCLRCRPESAPSSWAWKGVDTTIERALSLISRDPRASITDISAKLGISDRYLRKLFQQRIGMTPKRFQLYHQLLFAKKLLHETALDVEAVAHAAGFNSSRRLQDNFQQVMGLTPLTVRGRAKKSQNLRFKLAYRPPYDWAMVRDFFAVRAVPSVETVTDQSYARGFYCDGLSAWFCATFNAAEHVFDVELEIDNMAQLKNVIATIRRVLDMDCDAALISEHLERSGLTREQLNPGLRLPGIWDTFEAGCRAILGQQVSVKAAIRLVSTLVDELGSETDRGRLFPTPQQVASSSLAFLRMPSRRRQTLSSFAHHCMNGLPEKELPALLKVNGIGPWTVQYIEMRGCSNPDIGLETDLGVRKQLQSLNVDMALAAPWRSYLTLQLWNL